MLLPILLLSSCATGPSKEQLAAWHQEKTSNSTKIVDHFVDFIWNKPIKEVMRSEGVHYRLGQSLPWILKLKKFKVEQVYSTTFPAIAKSYTSTCNPSKPKLPMKAAVYNTQNNRYKKGQMFFVKYGLDTRWTEEVYVYNYKTKKGVKKNLTCQRGDKTRKPYNPLDSPLRFGIKSLPAATMVNMLRKRGVPLKFCHQVDKENGVRGIYCSFDWHLFKSTTKGYGHIMIPTLTIETKGSMLKMFEVSEMNISAKEKHLSLAQIYQKRLQDKKYFEIAKSFNAGILAQKKRIVAYEAKKERQAKADHRAYKRRIRAKFDAMDSGSTPPSSSGYNPYRLSNQEAQYMNALGSQSKSYSVPRVKPNVSYGSNRTKKYSATTDSKKVPIGPRVDKCSVNGNKTVGPLEDGKFCTWGEPKSAQSGCGFLLQNTSVTPWSNRYSHCNNIARARAKSQGKTYTGGGVGFKSWHIDSCSCGVSKYNRKICKANYVIICKRMAPNSGGSRGRAK
ncbi:MAG: hypothetical protein ACI9QD_000557 [Thermoproteota archaeon]|jgi:hypothetical protein